MIKLILAAIGLSSLGIIATIIIGFLIICILALIPACLIWGLANLIICPIIGWEFLSFGVAYVIALVFGFLQIVFS